ncbi:MAG: hypothetical protein RIG63_31535 [Coleofasciculus chthonoplastes F3-SA18-01]
MVEGQETEYNYFSDLKQDLKLPTTRELKQSKIECYDKSKSGYYGLLKPQLDQAIAKAKKLESAACTNPSTKVHDIVAHLQAQKGLIG